MVDFDDLKRLFIICGVRQVYVLDIILNVFLIIPLQNCYACVPPDYPEMNLYLHDGQGD